MTIHKKRNAVIAAVTGAALLLGGSTYALWSATANLGDTQIQAGDLSIKTDSVWVYDVSPEIATYTVLTANDQLAGAVLTPDNRAVRSGRQIMVDGLGGWLPNVALRGWKAVPGDMVIMQIHGTIALVGDNLVAELDAALDPTDPGAASLAQDATVSYSLTYVTQSKAPYPIHSVFDPDSTPVPVYNGFAVPPVPSMTVFFSTGDNNIATDKTMGSTPMTLLDPLTFVLNVYVTFNDSVNDQGRAGINELLTLSKSVKVNLTQIRG